MASFDNLSSQAEKVAILSLLIWLSSRDGAFSEAELAFVQDKMKQLGISQLTSVKAIKTLENPKPLLEAIQSLDAKQLLLESMIQLSFADGVYDARERVAIGAVLQGLEMSWGHLEQAEYHLTSCLKQDIQAVTNREKQDWNVMKALKIAALTVGGGAALAATGGLAAPLIGGAIGTTFLGLSGAAATSAGLALLGGGSLAAGGAGMAGGAALISAALGAGGAGMAAWKASHLMGDIKEWEIQSLDSEGLHVCLGVSSFLQQDDDHAGVWQPLTSSFPYSANYALAWESKALRDLVNVMSALSGKLEATKLVALAAGSATKKAFGMMALPAAVLSAFEIIDNPWAVAKNRAEQAGKLLGDYIAENQFGGLPVSLVGYSLGTKVIINAIDRLAELGVEGKIFDVYLLAGAVAKNDPRLQSLSRVVSGKVVNVYSHKDLVLSYIYRAAELLAQPIGNEPLYLEEIPVINIDVTESVGGHEGYKDKLGYILDLIRSNTGRENIKSDEFDEDCIGADNVYHKETKPISLDEEVIKILQNVPGMTPADPSDFNKSMKFARLRDNTTIRTWKNLAGVDHVFVEKGGRCIYAGYVGWIHSEGLHQVLNQIKRKFS